MRVVVWGVLGAWLQLGAALGGHSWGGPAGAGAVVGVSAVLGVALAALWLASRVVVPARVHGQASTWPGHPLHRAGGDLPRQLHPDSPGRCRSRAPGLP